jgi:hypothetical protein
MRDTDEFLADVDGVLADWHGSADAASWAADGSHQVELSGVYYGWDEPGVPTDALLRLSRRQRGVVATVDLRPRRCPTKTCARSAPLTPRRHGSLHGLSGRRSGT